MSKKSPRHLARSLAVQGLYHFKVNNTTQGQIEEFLRNSNHNIYNAANHELMRFLLMSGINNFDEMLNQYNPHLNREHDQINIIEQIILVIAAVELNNNHSVPAIVVINEAIELTKMYGAEDSYKFINGLVDKLARDIRPNEIK